MLTRRKLLLAALQKSRVKLGCQTRSFAPPTRDRAQLLAILAGIAQAGFTGFETNYIGLEAAFADPAEIREELARRKLQLIGLHMGVPFLKDPPSSLPLIEKVARGVKTFAGEFVIVSGTAAGNDAALRRKATFVEEAGKICRGEGVKLLLHNHVEESHNDWAEYRALPHAQLLVDIGHPARAKNDAAQFVHENQHRIAAIHVNDWQGEKPMRLGTGDAQLEQIGQVLRNWTGWAILELEGGRTDDRTDGGTVGEVVTESLGFMRRRMGF